MGRGCWIVRRGGYCGRGMAGATVMMDNFSKDEKRHKKRRPKDDPKKHTKVRRVRNPWRADKELTE
jgi:hypothetical protein